MVSKFDPTMAAQQAVEKMEREARGPYPKHSGTPVSEDTKAKMDKAARSANKAAELLKQSKRKS